MAVEIQDEGMQQQGTFPLGARFRRTSAKSSERGPEDREFEMLIFKHPEPSHRSERRQRRARRLGEGVSMKINGQPALQHLANSAPEGAIGISARLVRHRGDACERLRNFCRPKR